jgi:hypothetical protein
MDKTWLHGCSEKCDDEAGTKMRRIVEIPD